MKNMKKTLIAILLALSLLIALAGCRGDSDSGDSTSDTTQAATQSPEEILSALEEYYNSGSGTGDSTDPYASVPVTEPETLPDGEQIKVNTGSQNIPEDTYFYAYFKDMSNRGEFTLTATCSSNASGMGASVPITVAVSGQKVYTSVKVPIAPTISMSTNFIFNGTQSYIVLPDLRMYLTMDADEAQELVGDLTDINFLGGDMKYVRTTSVTVSGKQYFCEEYQSGSDVIKCYFTDNGQTLDRIEMLSSGNITVMKDVSLTSSADSSLFELPSGYRDMSGSDMSMF